MSNFSKSLNNNLQQKTGGMGLKGMIGGSQSTKVITTENTDNTESIETKNQLSDTISKDETTKPKKELLKRLPVDLPMELYDKLATKKIKIKLSMREMIIAALEEYLEK